MGEYESCKRPPCSQVDDGITRVFALLGKRWTGLVVAVLLQHPFYFTELRRAIPGITPRMLSDRLSELVTAGLVARDVDEGPPLRVAYRLTDVGVALKPAFEALGLWAHTHLSATESAVQN
ncbi:helix-turn-helix domain-containing protein [Streptomyces sp. NPDC002265]|uniref:winged helix-turn-helix transcriptional regulator n=1 Tax=Streptomyces sp. NPDC002265 TaxID=3154415 RepID=UPI003327F580